jgi:uncharacterized protein
VFSMAAAVLATRITPLVPAEGLKLGFGTLLTVSGIQLLRPGRPTPDAPVGNHLVWLGAVGGLAVGALSALLGVGGGLVAIPILVYVMGVRLEQVAATSLAIVVFTATAAVVGYAASGPAHGLMPPGSLGYIHYMAGLPILATTVLSVRLGTRVNQRLSTRALRLMFGVFFVLLGLRLVMENFRALPGIG